MTCTASIDIHGYLPATCESTAVDTCRECGTGLCSEHIDCLGRCAICAEAEDYPIEDEVIGHCVTIFHEKAEATP